MDMHQNGKQLNGYHYSNSDKTEQGKTNDADLRVATAHDDITLLRDARKGTGSGSQPALLTKVWKDDGTIGEYDKATSYVPEVRRVSSIRELSALLDELENERRACVIRGGFEGFAAVELARASKDDESPSEGRTWRRKTLFKDRPSHAIMVDVDAFRDESFSLVEDMPHVAPETWILHFIETRLPEQFHGVNFHWQLSASAGFVGFADEKKEETKDNSDTLKAHVWFWLSEAKTSAEMRPWATATDGVDESVFDPIQVHYTAAPIIRERNPVAVRSGFYTDGDRDTVDVSFLEGFAAESPSAASDRDFDFDPEEDKYARVDEDGLDALTRWETEIVAKTPWLMKAWHEGVFQGAHDPSRAHIAMAKIIRLKGISFDNYANTLMPNWPAAGKSYAAQPHRQSQRAWNKAKRPAEAPADEGFDTVEEGERSGPSPHQWANQRDRRSKYLDPLVEGFIPDAAVGVIYGQPTTGKSGVALDMTHSIARGTPWHGREVEQRDVFYVVAEGASDFNNRADAYRQFHGLGDTHIPFYTVEAGVTVNTEEGLRKFIGDLLEFKESTGPKNRPCFIVLDTLAQVTDGINENENGEISAVARNCNTIARVMNANVLIVAHSPKGEAHEDKGIRGASSLTGAADYTIVALRDKDDKHLRTVRVVKIKGGQEGIEFKYRFTVLPVGETPKGKPVTSIVVAPVEKDPHARPARIEPVRSMGEMVMDRYKAIVRAVHARNTVDTDLEPFTKATLARALYKQCAEFDGVVSRAVTNAIEDALSDGYLGTVEMRKRGKPIDTLNFTADGLKLIDETEAFGAETLPEVLDFPGN
ncbi:AAA family ATPase [Caballeronia sp. LZ035]|uniref:AAA family ATPase n=1 Tax=Caballeronia sp. LZ035 TaxID=3038568 RepID=UPI002859A0B4|nr:AAA family ATPase [Caballeronia sp. LZ035]MDR5758205.1 AAA family ATPase [Caballeronia sp. LZ035]